MTTRVLERIIPYIEFDGAYMAVAQQVATDLPHFVRIADDAVTLARYTDCDDLLTGSCVDSCGMVVNVLLKRWPRFTEVSRQVILNSDCLYTRNNYIIFEFLNARAVYRIVGINHFKSMYLVKLVTSIILWDVDRNDPDSWAIVPPPLDIAHVMC